MPSKTMADVTVTDSVPTRSSLLQPREAAAG
jgi:hypothetical protein